MSGDVHQPSMPAVSPDSSSSALAATGRSMGRGKHSDAAVAEQTQSLAQPLEQEQAASISLLCFRVANERFALPAPCVERVFLVPVIRRIPHRNRPAFRGMVAHEGEILLMGSLERLLNLESPVTTDPAKARAVLLAPAGRGWAFEVNQIDGVVQVKETDLRAPPSTVARGLGSATRCLVQLPGGDASVLDPDVLRQGWEAAIV